ncbi:acetolactate decarboxylase [Ligilactobacillus sp. WILCCON 0076]|uniref:Alpha-acetolactate decarboxylase n=1 Tax=Ligilactobacillus ubinensis TaxID=2876789 RepID=A0A9X2JLS3_9LACO|nr:acetolactate decarboxylase [Ligilactobacillus ubinensis]MCP0887204.1 acetolactate decarboxylase [Ligilactobacillus ubinensis]
MTKDTTRVFQHGTLATLVPGLLDGTIRLDELAKHGDAGIGTATGLDGEMIMLDGVAYLVRSTGEVKVLGPDTLIPFATVHFDDQNVEDGFEVHDLDMKQLSKHILANYPYHNIFFAVKIVGNFKYMQTRAVKGQKKPYPTLAEVASEQAIFYEEDSKGTVIGYFSPELFQGMAAAGYHLHYLDEAKTMGGHILSFGITDAKVFLQPFATIEQHLPLDNADFMHHKLDMDGLSEEIKKAEE